MDRNLAMIANEIRAIWGNSGKGVSPYAKPYLDAMLTMDKISDNYYEDSGASVVAYFLSNANSWRGPVAKAIKAELNAMLKRRNG